MPGFAATDLFSVGAGAAAQSSSTSETRERARSLGSTGDVLCESGEFNVTTEYTADYQSCAASGTGGVATVLGAFLTAFGEVVQSKLVTGIEITLSNKDYPTFSITGHNHASNPHLAAEGPAYDVSTAIPDQIGSGITMPMLASNLAISIGATSDVTGATFSIGLEHTDTEGADGNHVDGQSMTCVVSVTLSGIGVESDVSFGSDWFQDDAGDADSNTESDTFTASAHTNFTRT